MPILKFADDTALVLKKWIHEEYGRHSRLFIDDYRVEFDPFLRSAFFIQAGKVIRIVSKYPIFHPYFETALARIFEIKILREFKQSSSVVLVSQKDLKKWKSFSVSDLELLKAPSKKEQRVIKYQTQEYKIDVTEKIVITDNKTKNKVEAECSPGHVFENIDKLLEFLYKK